MTTFKRAVTSSFILLYSMINGAAIPQTLPATVSMQASGANGNAAGADRNASAWEAIGLREAAHFARFKRKVKVAIIDDGFDIDNPVWAAHIAHNPGEIPENSIDDDHNGKTDDYEGWDFGDNDENVRPGSNVVDKESHGTRVLGIFWQVLEQLSAGDLSGISILPIKAVSDVKLNNYLKEGYKGIGYAIEQKADIIICSWSGPFIAPEEKDILQKAHARGIMVIAAAGNFYAMQPMYPGAVSSVINVAAVDREGRKLRVSNYGNFVDISAPGDSLVSFDPYKKTANAYISATSAATPVIGAVITAIRAAYPELSTADIERILKNTATPLEKKNPLYAGNLGAGLVNVAAIRDAMQVSGKAISDHVSGNVISGTPGGKMTGVKAYIDLRTLRTDQPVRIAPEGRYRYIKFLLQQDMPGAGGLPATASLPDIRATVFDGGKSRDTIVRKERLLYPLLLTGDSVLVYRLADKRRTTMTGRGWWYYEVTTVDSSTLYCGGVPTVVNGSEGYVEDGSGDQSYTGRNDCKWQITVPDGKKIKLEFQAFDTEPKLDQVYIFNGNSTKDPILAIFSGHKLPPTIKSWGNTVLVWFLTNEENNFQGWKLHYKAVD